MRIRKNAREGGRLPVFLLFSMLFLTVFSVLSPDDDVATALYKEGIKKYILEDYESAVRDFESAYRIKPDDPKIRGMYINTLIKQGNIEYQQENLKAAREYYKKALSLSGEDPDLRDKLAVIQRNIDEEETLREQESRIVVRDKVPEEGVSEKPDAREPEIVRRAEEVELPFDLDGYIRQQDESNKRLLAEVQEQQRLERERLLQSIEENQRIINENMEAQQQERKSFMHNIEANSRILSSSFEEQRRERETLMGNVRENQQFLRESIERQGEEREYFLKNMVDIIQSQSDDRKMFNRSLMILVIGGIVIAIIIVLGFIMLLRRRISQVGSVYHEPQPSIGFSSGPMLEYDDTKYLTNEHYTDMVRVRRLKELEQEIRKGDSSWETVQGYISELNHEVKSEILSIVENKIKSGDTAGIDNAMEILLPFITDGDKDIGVKSKRLVRRIAGGAGGGQTGFETGEDEDPSDPLGTASLLNMAAMADTKTGRIDHSKRVAEVASLIAETMGDDTLDPSVVRRVGLAHDIGYLEIADTIMKTEGELTERQFAIIKTHPERGLKLLQHVELPKIFYEGIRYHHERLDGSGYPEGLTDREIPKIAKVLAVADFFDAVTSARPHRPALTVESAFQMMEKLAGKIFDKKLFEALVSIYKQEIDQGE
ncbi:MAG: HD domain-containing protein [Spirochaetes bacterium]|nr:HD domain-containing protein [Spirochaetota bacterium]